MGIVLGTSSGFVTTAPTSDPKSSDTVIDGSAVVTKHTAPAGARKITEIGWYRGGGTNTANFEIALYDDDGGSELGAAGTRLYVDDTNSSTSSGWIRVTVDWNITPGQDYWLGLQMDAHISQSSVDSATSGGAGSDVITSQTTLEDPWQGGGIADADGIYAIYALVTLDKEVTPSTGSLLLTGLAATVFATNLINISPAPGELALAGFAPTVFASNSINVSSDVGRLIINGYAPNVVATLNQIVIPGTGELLLSGFASTVATTDHKEVTPSVGELALTGLAPSVFATDLKNVFPDVGSLILTGSEPTVFASNLINITADVGQLVLTGYSPTASISDNKNIQTDVGSLVLTGFEPVAFVGNAINIEAGLGELVLTGFEPTAAVTNLVVVSPDVGALILTGFNPTIETTNNVSASPDTGALLLIGYAPSAVATSSDWRNPSSLTQNAGAIVSGTLADTYKDSSATELVLSEVTGTPGFDYDFEFGVETDVPSSSLHLYVEGYYDGNVAHTVKLQQWNYNTSGWEDVSGATFPDESSEQNYKFRLKQGVNYISSGNIKLKVIHTSPGNPVHQFLLDKFYVDLTEDKEVQPLTGSLVITGYAPDVYKTAMMYRWDGASWIYIGHIKILS